jgi:hypothetical protein
MSEFKIFKNISIGGVAKDRLMNQLVETGVQFNEYAKILDTELRMITSGQSIANSFS